MSKNSHEIRCPIHVFVRYDDDERKVLDSRPFQRLRQIHQLALTYLLYPGASHKRFEHSLGVMELAGRIFDIVTHPDNVTDAIRRLLPEITQRDKLGYWRRVLRMAALCHDTGHLPFSHAAEKALLPRGWDHERISRAIICSPEMCRIWEAVTPPLRPLDIVKLALGPRKAKKVPFTTWEAILAEIIVGDSFGADRIDYLLRDSYHVGVAYGRFDHARLIDTLRILPSVTSADGSATDEPALGIEEGGLHSAEALLLARYFMYSQVYWHPVRRIYDIHLQDFLSAWLPGGKLPTDIAKHLALTDNEVITAIRMAARRRSHRGHEPARWIDSHQHFRRLYERTPEDVKKNPEVGEVIYRAARRRFKAANVRHNVRAERKGAPVFPVLTREKGVKSPQELSTVLQQLPVAAMDTVYVHPEKYQDALAWLAENRDLLTAPPKEDS